ncbi:MalY/PatB family protein [Microvirga zambiensis]|uniref:MalY/PatB family protein n=1 Tax=Microvirga zambiensis TaxID=1402137 RepID=UPI001FE77B2F|nr:PatB family C-S lyase [Microvirga zambiensis]
MMTYNFDTPIERRGTGSSKWSKYSADVLPMWVADMDFAAAPEIIEAIVERLEHPILGYGVARDQLRAQIVADLARIYQWIIQPEDIVFLPGVEPGFNMAIKAMLEPGDTLAIQSPIYRPILKAPDHWNLRRIDINASDLSKDDLQKLAASRAFLLCNPHNPTGKVYTPEELHDIAAATEGRVIISDEIHCDLLFDSNVHTPIASLSSDVAWRTITLMSAAKTYNIPGLKTAFAIIQNPEIRDRFAASRLGMVDSVNVLGLEATLAAFSRAESWKRDLLDYLQANRDYLVDTISARFPSIKMKKPQATFLAWLDCSELNLPDPQQFFLDNAKVGLSAGHEFGEVYSKYVRLNFGCSRATLIEGLDRMEAAIASRLLEGTR